MTIAQDPQQRRERIVLFVAACAGALAALSATDNSEWLAGLGAGDSAVLLLMFVTNALLCLWLLLVPRQAYRNEAVLVLLVNGGGLIARLGVGLFVSAPEVGIADALPPQHGWMPLIFVVAFAVLPARPALGVSFAAYAAMAILVLVFLATHAEQITDTIDGRALVRQYVLGHLAYVALLWLIVNRKPG